MKLNVNKINYTLISGGSEGIGLAFAMECASRNQNLILVAIDKDLLKKASIKVLEKFNVKLEIFSGDLSNSDVIFQLYNWCVEKGFQINFLINNVGIGSGGPFAKYTAEFYLKQLNLNNNAMVLLTRLFYDNLKINSPSYILNISSLGAYQPMPFKSVYAATKTFIYFFSRSITTEFKKENIHVSVVLPGPVLTNIYVQRRINQLGWIVKQSVLMPQQVAKKTLAKIFNGKHVIIPGFVNKILYFFGSITPIRFKNYFITKTTRKF